MISISRRGFIAALAGTSAMMFSGCSGNTDNTGDSSSSASEPQEATQTGEPQGLEIVESGWSVNDSGFVMYGIGIKNPNGDKEADFPSFTITGKKADGSIAFSDEQTLFVIAPNETVYYGFQAGNGTVPDTVEFAITDSDFSDCSEPESDIFTIANISEVIGDYGLVSYTGELTLNVDLSGSSAPTVLEQTAVTVILRNADNAIVYGTSTFVDTPDQGASVPFEISAYSVPEHASFEIHAQLW